MKRTLLLAVLLFGSAYLVAAPDAPIRKSGNRPLGVWEQSNDEGKITLTITADRLHIRATGKDNKLKWLIDADYSVTKDNIVYGIVTSIEDKLERLCLIVSTRPLSPEWGPDDSRLSVDDLFGFRFRIDDDILTIKHVKSRTEIQYGELALRGRFKKVEKSEKAGYKKDNAEEKETHPPTTSPSPRLFTGNPAKFHQGELSLTGQKIAWDQGRNKVWIDGKGTMQIDSVPILAEGTSKDSAALKLSWQQSMLDAGSFAEISGSVKLEQGNGRIDCQNLQMVFDRPLSLHDTKKAMKALRIRKLVCDREVHLENSVRDKDALVWYQAIEGTAATISATTEKDDAQREYTVTGPGAWRLFRVLKLKKEDDKRLTYLQFDKLMKASERTRVARFWQNVRLVLLPSEDAARKIDLKAMPAEKLPKDGLYLRCDELRLLAPSGGTKFLQLDGRGRIELRTSEIQGQAERVRYDEKKDQLVFVGSSKAPATLTLVKKRGVTQMIRGATIVYDRRTGEVTTNQQEIDGN